MLAMIGIITSGCAKKTRSYAGDYAGAEKNAKGHKGA